ncbi:MAG: hypothetical protein ACK515_00845 [bacterium]|jgi:hypothetical protein|nr:hypothetical protein [Betaproteobacteria bacterium]
MAVILAQGPDEVRRWIDDLRTRLIDPVVHHVLPPLAAVQVDRPAADFGALVEHKSPPRDDQDLLALFAIARAGIRLSHVVTSPWYFAFARDVGRRARWSARWLASRRPLAAGVESRARSDFAVLAGTLFDASENFSVHDILETHAIVSGLQASMARPSALALYHLAVELYGERPASLRLLSRLASLFDIELAVTLAPRLCSAALRFPFPAIALSDLLASLEQNRHKVDRLVGMSAERFFAACRLDASNSARSARELAVNAHFLENDAWDESLRGYFDRYEALSGDEERLQASIYPMHPAPPPAPLDGPPLFQPTWLLFPDGQVADLRAVPGSLTDHARWVADALGLLDGLAWLGEQAAPG